MPVPPKKTISRSLGEFFGHVIKGAKTDPAASCGTTATGPTTRRETTTEEARDTPAGTVILRRTVVEEVILPKPDEQAR